MSEIFFSKIFWLYCIRIYVKSLSIPLKVETLKREKEEALLASDSYRAAYEEQLSQNTSLLFELLEKSGWLRKKLGWCIRNSKKVTEQPSPENCLSLDEEVLLRQLQTHKDEQVQRLVHMVSFFVIITYIYYPSCNCTCAQLYVHIRELKHQAFLLSRRQTGTKLSED